MITLSEIVYVYVFVLLLNKDYLTFLKFQNDKLNLQKENYLIQDSLGEAIISTNVSGLKFFNQKG